MPFADATSAHDHSKKESSDMLPRFGRDIISNLLKEGLKEAIFLGSFLTPSPRCQFLINAPCSPTSALRHVPFAPSPTAVMKFLHSSANSTVLDLPVQPGSTLPPTFFPFLPSGNCAKDSSLSPSISVHRPDGSICP